MPRGAGGPAGLMVVAKQRQNRYEHMRSFRKEIFFYCGFRDDEKTVRGVFT
jgi:hypothetical protein